MVFSLKLVLQNDIRRVNLDPQTFDQAKGLVKELFRIEGDFTFRYLDNEGDNLTISSDREFSEILRIHEGNCLKLVVVPTSSENSPQKPTHAQLPPRGPHHFRGPHHPHRGFPFPHPHQNDGNGIPSGPHHPPPHAQGQPAHGHPHHGFAHHPGFVPLRRHCPRRSMEPRTNAEGKVAHWANCDSCAAKSVENPTIFGIRYKCTACPDYDLCEKCYELEKFQPGSVHDKEHDYEKIERPIPFPFCGRRGLWRNIPVQVVPGSSEEKSTETIPEKVNEIPPVDENPAGRPKIWCGYGRVNEIPSVNAVPEVNAAPEVNVIPDIKKVDEIPVPEPVKEIEEVKEVPQVKEEPAPEPEPVKIEEIPAKQPENDSFALKIEQLESMGFPKAEAIDALFHAKGDIIQAVQKLLSI